MGTPLLSSLIKPAFAAAALVFSTAALTAPAFAADQPPAAAAADKPAEGAPAADKPAEGGAAGGSMTAIERVNSTEKGKLKNPFTDKPQAIEEGKKLYMANSCNGCHGGGGGGGMCPPLTNDTFVYGSDDDTLFRLITLGTKKLQAGGYARKGQEGVVGPMPGYEEIITKEEDLWKIIAWIRTVYRGSKRNW